MGERRRRTRLRIIKGAAAAFGRDGFEATTIPDILDAAGVSRRTLYQYFPDKSALLATIYERSTAHLLKAREQAMAGPGNGLDRLRRGQQVFFDFVTSAGPIVQVLAGQAMRPESPLAPRRLWLHQRIEDLYRDSFREAEGRELVPLAVRALILSTETLILHVQLHHDGDTAVLAQARQLLGWQLEQLVQQTAPATKTT